MKKKLRPGIRIKFLLIFMLGSIMAGLTIVLLQTAFIKYCGIAYEEIMRLEEKYTFVYFGLFLMLTTLFSFMLSSKIIAKIVNMSATVDEIKQGNLNIRIPVDTNDELGELANHLNHLVIHLQESLEREQQAETMKNDIITNISHDLRTPLTSLMGYMDLVQTHLRQDIDASERYIAISQRKGRELKQQIDELLEYCHLNFSGIKLNLEAVAVKSLVQQVMIDFVPQLEEAGMSFEIKAESEKKYIEADIGLVIRLLQNIIGNSIFYGKEGKKITICIETVGSQVKINVINYGKPIAAEDMPYVFEKLYRGERSRSSNNGGKGMGLAIAKSIAELHRGEITVHSDESETVFAFLMPECR